MYRYTELVQAFAEQIRLYEQGFPTAKLLTHHGQVLLESDNGEIFMVMEFCEGGIIPHGQLSSEQMYDLGRGTGQMHRLMNDGTMGVKSRPEFIPPSPQERLAYWKTVLQKVDEANQETATVQQGVMKSLSYNEINAIVEQQLQLTRTIHLEDYNLEATGWAHRDLWLDNLLFKEDRVSAVLDFDRLKYDYPQLDVARAIMSGALHDNKLNVSLADAFIQGYRESHDRNVLTKSYLSKALKLLWYMESTWWIHEKMAQQSGPSTRFAEEMVWLGTHYNELDAMLGDSSRTHD